MEIIKLFIGRVLAGLIAALAGWLSTKFGIILDAETQAQLAANTTTQLVIIFSVVYPVLHKLFDRRLNPGDAASRTLASKEKLEVKQLTSHH